MRERFRDVLATKDNQPERNRFEYRFRHRDGSWCWLESVAVNALANPAVLGIIAHSRDITRRKANEHILSLNHARYRTVADLSAGAVHEYVMNAQGVYELEWTLGTERVYGCSEEEYRRRGWQSFHVSEGWEEASLARTRRYLAGETVEFTVPIRRTDGANPLDRGQESTDRRSGHRQVHTPRGRRGGHHRTQAGGRRAARKRIPLSHRGGTDLRLRLRGHRRCGRRGADGVGQSRPGTLFRRRLRGIESSRLAARVPSRRSCWCNRASTAAADWANAPRWNWR